MSTHIRDDFIAFCQRVQASNLSDQDKCRAIHSEQYRLTVSELESRLRGAYDYDDIMNAALVATRTFYDADDVVLANTDLSAGIAGNLVRELPREGFASICGTTPVYLANYPKFQQMLSENRAIAIPDIRHLFPEGSPEHKRLVQSNMHSFIAVPYQKRTTGFVAVINPRRYTEQVDLLQVLSYVVVAEINEKRLMEMLTDRKEATIGQDNANRVYVRFINGLEIHHQGHVLSEVDFKGLSNVRLLAFLLLNHGTTYSEFELIEFLWSEKIHPANERKTLQNMCGKIRESMRQYFPESSLITCDNNRYGISREYVVETDCEAMYALWGKAEQETDRSKKAALLEEALREYEGVFLPSLNLERCFETESSYFDLYRLEMLNTYLGLLDEDKRYGKMLALATQAYPRHFDNPTLLYWLIRAYIGCGQIRLARRRIHEWRSYLEPEQESVLKDWILAAQNRRK